MAVDSLRFFSRAAQVTEMIQAGRDLITRNVDLPEVAGSLQESDRRATLFHTLIETRCGEEDDAIKMKRLPLAPEVPVGSMNCQGLLHRRCHG